MARAIEKGATYLDKLCHKLYDEPKGRGFQVDGKCRRCGGPLMTYYCEDRLHLIACEKCGTLALTKAVSPQVAANLTLRQPTLTPPNEPLTMEELRKMDGEPVYMTFPSDTGNQCGHWALVGTQRWGAVSLIYGCGWSSYESAVETLGAKFYRRPPEGEEHCYG
ncbi:MAG: hypothetical protein KHX28_08215 [Oscillospiraceae bacterium]|nr:hypothetical protein [Oscillospiraceae bacterium]DAT04820.1 MAG TPA: hypothetical protein [Caudoviricetes sp.]DAW42278.1 MAG TPA: hypothetical protein [Caudoviricetes sp.]